MSGQEMAQLITDKLRGWLEAAVSKLPDLLLAIVVLVLFWLVAKGVRAAVARALERLSDNRAVNRLLGTLAYLGLLVAGVFFALGILELDKTVTSLLAGAGIIGLALAFAFQDAAENLVSGVTISIRQPFAVGDFIETNGHMGTVEDITLRTTALRRIGGQLLLIPNASVFRNPLINYSNLADRRIDVEIGISYADDLEKARRVAIEAVEGIEGRDTERPPELYYTGFGGSSIDCVLRFWLRDDYPESFLVAQSEAIVRIKQAFDREGITIPFPVTTLDFGGEGGGEGGEALAAMLGRRPG